MAFVAAEVTSAAIAGCNDPYHCVRLKRRWYRAITQQLTITMSTLAPWKKVVYNNYVSSHQARDTGEPPASQFRSRSAYINKIIAKHIPADLGANIIDLGCGHGAFLYFLAKAGYTRLSGVDVSFEQVELARRLGIDGVQHGDLLQFLIALDNASVDVVLLMDVLEHLMRAEMFELLGHVHRVLRPGGKCIAHVPNAEGLYGMRIRYGDISHEQAFTAMSAQQVFLTSRFSNVACYEDKPVVHGPISLARRIIWECGVLPHRILLAAETGAAGGILSQNLMIVASN